MNSGFMTVDELAGNIPDGALVAIPKEDAGAAMSATRALIRRGARNLGLLTVPVGSLQTDLLVGAGCVARIETSGVSLGEFGFAPQFRRAVQTGTVQIRDATCPAIYAALQASEKGLPFMPLRGLLGSDILANRLDWQVIDNPFATEGSDPVVLLPAIRPDIALFHARYGDTCGNVWAGPGRECVLLAHASKRTFATVEEIWDGNLLDDEFMRSGTIPPVYLDGVAHAPLGAQPLGLPGCYDRDSEHLRSYAETSPKRFEDYLREYVFEERAAA